MKKILIYTLTTVLLAGSGLSCVTTKKRNETSKAGKFYHNTTAYYNGYWNAKELLKESLIAMRDANVDDYNNILEVEDFVSLENPKMVKPEMDKILDKVSTVAQLHEPSDWVDDCYVMMAKAQYMKQEYETAEETLEYFQEDFNPANPYGRNYKNKKLTGKAAQKAKKAEKAEKQAEKKKVAKEKEEAKKEKAKTKAQERKEKEKERKAAQKAREKERKLAAKNRKKGIKPTPKKQIETAETTELAVTPDTKPAAPKIIDEEEETFTPTQKPKDKPKDKTAYSEGLLWLAKVYIKRENYFPARLLLDKLDPETLNDDTKRELAPTYANLLIKQKKYNEAIPKLMEAIETAPNRSLKGRYAFIAGQLANELGQSNQALDYYAMAKRFSSDIQMEFMAKMAIAKNGILTGTRSKSSVTKELEKMAEENKNKELKDQIYFTIGEIELSENNTNKAIEYFKKSAAVNEFNNKLKAETYYNIARIHYEAEDFLPASTYFDSTMIFLSNMDPRHTEIKKYADNLKDIAHNIDIINYQDTLLYFASLDGKEQQKAIINYLKSGHKKKTATPKTPIRFPVGSSSTGNVNFGTSSFFAYNPRTKELGKAEFKKVWGNISLSDDWRRSSNSAFNAEDDDFDQLAVSEDDGNAEAVTRDEYDAFMREIPINSQKVTEVNTKITNAMFTLGKLFRDKIQNYRKSAGVLENMHNRYGPTPYELDSYFYLYLDYMDLENATKQKEYADKITTKYPNSEYASIIGDPDYLAKQKLAGNKAEKYYRSVYSLYERKQYPQVLEAINQASGSIGDDHEYKAKMALIKAMALGNVEGKEAYVTELNHVISSYPNTAEQSKAKEIMRLLGGDKNAFVNVQDVDKIYNRDPFSVHYVAVVTYNLEESKHINFKIAISDYNKKNFKVERLQLGDAVLNIQDNVQIILIRKFENEEKAMAYYNKVQKEKDSYTSGENYTYDVFPISQSNYRKMISERSSAGYRIYFEREILGL